MVKQIRLCNVAMNSSLLHTISYARSHPVTKCRDESIIFLLYPIESYNSAFNLIFEYNLSTIIR
jgi:hypothetical protein